MTNPDITTNGVYILYADDDPDDRAILTEMLRKVNDSIRLVCLANGLELLQFLEQLETGARLPSCIILDMNMPVMNGIRTLQSLKEDAVFKYIPTFIFSTSSNTRDMDLAKTFGAEGFVTKPYGQKELYSVCEDFLEYALKPSRYKAQGDFERTLPS